MSIATVRATFVFNVCKSICCEILCSKGLNRCGSKTVLLNLAAFASAGGPAEPAAGGAAVDDCYQL